MMKAFFTEIKNIFFNLKNRVFGKHYRLVIWSEKLQTNQLHLEVLYIDNNFDRNDTISGIFYICNLNDDEIMLYLDHLRNKYKIHELVETNYKFENSNISSKFIITKTDKLLFQNV